MTEEIMQMQKNEELIYNSMFWSYMILTRQMTIDDIYETDEDFGLIFDPYNIKGVNPMEIIDVLIEYFVDLEEYEKCQDLVEAKNYYKGNKKGA